MEKSNPFYICIGAQRSATTWIYRILSNIEGISLPDTKEIDFFRYLGNYSHGLEWYQKHFDNVNMNLDITPEYAVAEESIKLIDDHLGEKAKILFVVRDPIERIVSAYQKHLRNGDLQCDFEFFIKYNIDHCVDRSLYHPTIERASKYYQPTVLVYEDIKKNPSIWLEGINKFFGVNIDLEKSKSKFNPSSGLGGARGVLNKIYRLAPAWLQLRALKEKIEGTAFGNKLLYGGAKKDEDFYKAINSNSELMRLFAEDRVALEKYTGRTLSELWRRD